MKKLLVSLVLSLALCLTLATGAFAAVKSPEHPNTPVDDKPTSPQTGEISPVVVIAGMTIVAACAAAYVVRKEKAAR